MVKCKYGELRKPTYEIIKGKKVKRFCKLNPKRKINRKLIKSTEGALKYRRRKILNKK